MSVEGSRVRKLLFLALFLALFLFVARLFYPFLTILLWSGLIYALSEPLHRRLLARLERSRPRPLAATVLAGLFAVGAVLVVAVPVFYLCIALVRQVGDLASSIASIVEGHPEYFTLSPEGPLGRLVERLSGGRLDLSAVDLIGEVKDFAASKSREIIGFSGALLKDALGIVVALALMVFTLYFFFADGRRLAATLVAAVPIESRYTTLFLRKLRETGRELVVGYLLVSLLQGAIMLLLCLAFGVSGSLVLACLTVVASFVPMIGTSLVWLPVSATIALSGHLGAAIAFLVLSAVLVATTDNFLRPMLLHDRLKIHPLLIFFAILGGLQIFGFNGLLLGPLVLMLFFSATELFDKAYAREEPEDGEKA